MATCVDCDAYFDARGRTYSVRCYPCYKRWKAYCDDYDPYGDKTSSDTVDNGLLERVRTLIQLCHPDKHGNSKASTEITQWLLSLPRGKS